MPRADDAPESPLLSVPQLVRLLAQHGVQMSTSKAYDWLAAGIIPSSRVGALYCIHRSEVLDWVANGRRNHYPEAAPAPEVHNDLSALLLGGMLELVTTIHRRPGR